MFEVKTYEQRHPYISWCTRKKMERWPMASNGGGPFSLRPHKGKNGSPASCPCWNRWTIFINSHEETESMESIWFEFADDGKNDECCDCRLYRWREKKQAGGFSESFAVWLSRSGITISDTKTSTLVENDSGSEDDFSDEDTESNAFDEKSDPNMISTKRYGKLHFRAAETLLLNGGRSSIGTKSRKARFTSDAYTGITSDIMAYRQLFCGCADALRIGMVTTLPRHDNSAKLEKGKISYISIGHAPLKFHCKVHSVMRSTVRPVVWLSVSDCYIRCTGP